MRFLLISFGLLSLVSCSALDEFWDVTSAELACGEHYARCIDSPLGGIWDEVNQTRCARCNLLCNRDDGWPDETAQGDTCRYWDYTWAIDGVVDAGR